jgi:tRNA (guanine-N7-)-methyltransferase
MSSDQVKAMLQASVIFQPASYIERLDLRKLFVSESSLEIELGAGDGSFLAQWARLNPGRNFLGVERLLGRLRKTNRKVGRAGLTNVRLVRLEAAYFLEYLVPLASVSALHIYFPDPWPKRKQRRNRLINPEFAHVISQALVPQGRVYLRTDDRDYFEQMRAVFAENRTFQEIPTPIELQNVLTDFERGFLLRKVATLRAAYAKM